MSSSSSFKISVADIDKLQAAMKEYQGDVEGTINDVLHNQGGELIQDAVRRLIPVSGKSWKGKPTAAKKGNSLTNINANLSVTVTTTKKYQYLYFPDDGTNTRRHVGNKRFFERGGESVKDEIIDRCIAKLTNNFEEGV
jgi:HK97 gp10 family phage protein